MGVREAINTGGELKNKYGRILVRIKFASNILKNHLRNSGDISQNKIGSIL